MILGKIRASISPGMRIPKPEAKADFIVKGWGKRRDEPALIYVIPNHKSPSNVLEKGIAESEFEKAYMQLKVDGQLSRSWFNQNLGKCAKEGSCNFTTIGGIFEQLGIARYAGKGIYTKAVDFHVNV